MKNSTRALAATLIAGGLAFAAPVLESAAATPTPTVTVTVTEAPPSPEASATPEPTVTTYVEAAPVEEEGTFFGITPERAFLAAMTGLAGGALLGALIRAVS